PPHAPPLLPSFPTRRSSDLRSPRRITTSSARPQSQMSSSFQTAAVNPPPGHKRPTICRAINNPNNARNKPSQVLAEGFGAGVSGDRKSTRLNSSHDQISYAV